MNPPPEPPPARSGTAAVECAVCLPVLLLFVLGLVEACTVIFLKQSLTTAAYEGAQTGLRRGATAADVRAVAERVLTDRRVTGGGVSVSPAGLPAVAEGDPFTVTVTAPASGAVLVSGLYSGTTLSASVTMSQQTQ